MKRLLPFLLLLSSLTASGKEGARDILIVSVKKINNTLSISYHCSYKMKYLNHEDTNFHSGDVYLLKAKSDTLFHSYIWFATSDTSYRFYDLDSIYVVNQKRKKVIVYNAHGGEDWPISGGPASGMLLNSYTDGKTFNYDTSLKHQFSFEGDTVIEHRKCYSILIKYASGDLPSEEKSWIYIDKESELPVLIKNTILFQGNYQYREWHNSNYQLNTVKPEQFSAAQIPHTYTRETYNSTKAAPAPPKLLDSNTTAPVVKGRYYFNNLKTDSINFSKGITLLDFWYMGCIPCISAIPEIEKIKEKYKDKGLQIFGINAYDNNEDGVKRLPKFLQYNNLRYPIILVNKTIADDYKVTGWPTFYLIDKTGKVFFHTVGYSEDLEKTISEAIDKLLQSN